MGREKKEKSAWFLVNEQMNVVVMYMHKERQERERGEDRVGIERMAQRRKREKELCYVKRERGTSMKDR